MHRFYQPLLPSSNLFLIHKWDFIDFETHRHCVRTVKSKVDQAPPRMYAHQCIKTKHIQQELERFCSIQRHNKYLMDRIQKIYRFGGWTDHHNTNYRPTSRNTVGRQREAVRINYANETMAKRIRDIHPCYPRSQFDGYFVIHEKYRAVKDRFMKNWKDLQKDMKRYRHLIRIRYVFPRCRKVKVKGRRKKVSAKKKVGDTKKQEAKIEQIKKTLWQRIIDAFKAKKLERLKEPEKEVAKSDDEEVAKSRDSKESIEPEKDQKISKMSLRDSMKQAPKKQEDLHQKLKLEQQKRYNDSKSKPKPKAKLTTTDRITEALKESPKPKAKHVRTDDTYHDKSKSSKPKAKLVRTDDTYHDKSKSSKPKAKLVRTDDTYPDKSKSSKPKAKLVRTDDTYHDKSKSS
ncbi:uncharacterized protein CDAR_107951 [Caerostris darwini]|uniref:Uncharacterized protein n=1 Tax=Caerostris darwini TaxID=1538125 RepID=A0AAV4X3W4_9ARAC|nr:uncharacterized protein CDAR_107951 [Caerostris darwini]